MERLTNSGTKEAKSNVTTQEVIDKLAAYEEIGTVKDFEKALQNVKTLSEMYEKLSDKEVLAYHGLTEYEDLEKQGKLLKLPCAVDSEVWYIDKYAELYTEIVRGVVDGYLWYRSCGFALNVVWDKPIMGHFGYKRKEVPFSKIGKTVFLTKEEAESALIEEQNI